MLQTQWMVICYTTNYNDVNSLEKNKHTVMLIMAFSSLNNNKQLWGD